MERRDGGKKEVRKERRENEQIRMKPGEGKRDQA